MASWVLRVSGIRAPSHPIHPPNAWGGGALGGADQDPARRLNAAEALDHRWLKLGQAPVTLGSAVLKSLRTFAQSSHLRRAALTMLAYSLTSSELEAGYFRAKRGGGVGNQAKPSRLFRFSASFFVGSSWAAGIGARRSRVDAAVPVGLVWGPEGRNSDPNQGSSLFPCPLWQHYICTMTQV